MDEPKPANDIHDLSVGKVASWLTRQKLFKSAIAVCAVIVICAALVSWHFTQRQSALTDSGIHKIKHIVIIMQENRSFDSYFGTFPGADGIPMKNGVPTVCVNDPKSGQCIKPFHDPRDINQGGPHGAANAAKDIDAGKMDGFIQQAELARQQACKNPDTPGCTGGQQELDSMGYHDAREIRSEE